MSLSPESRSNSFAFLRFVLASAVIVAHASPLGGYPTDVIGLMSADRVNLGGLAVMGFFFLSGFLVAKSYLRLKSLPRFMWHRALRIFPGYWICLVVTAFVFAPMAYLHDNGAVNGFLRGAAFDGPLQFLQADAWLHQGQYTIDGLPKGIPFPGAFNGSLWTLENEFRCYIALAIIGFLGILRGARWLVVAVFILAWIPSTSAMAFNRMVAPYAAGNYFFYDPSLLQMVDYFFLGALGYLYRNSIPFDLRLTLLAIGAIIASISSPYFNVIVPFAFGYILYYAAFRLPIYNFDKYGDFSYGIYIYAFPVQQLLALIGLNRLGFWPYAGLAFAGTLPLAILSWKLIEGPALRLKDMKFPPVAGAVRTAVARIGARRSDSAAPPDQI